MTKLQLTIFGYAGVFAVGLLVLATATLALRPTLFPLLPMPRLRKGRWSGREVFFAFFLLVMVPGLVIQMLESIGFFQSLYTQKPSSQREQLWANPLSQLLIIASLLGFLHVNSQTRPGHLGLTWSQVVANSWRGLFLYALATPVVLGIYWLTQEIGGKGKDHSFQELTQKGLMPIEWVLLVGQAVILGPIFEELLFRGVFMGWLRRASLVGHGTVATIIILVGIVFSIHDSPDDPAQFEVNTGPIIFGAFLGGIYVLCVLRVWLPILQQGNRYFFERRPNPTEGGGVKLQRDEGRWQQWLTANARLGILGSAILFGMVHGRVWPTPIPLLFLGLGLGWLANRTQSLVGPIVCHGLFNAVACVELLASNGVPSPHEDPKGKEARTAWCVPLASEYVRIDPGCWQPRRK